MCCPSWLLKHATKKWFGHKERCGGNLPSWIWDDVGCVKWSSLLCWKFTLLCLLVFRSGKHHVTPNVNLKHAKNMKTYIFYIIYIYGDFQGIWNTHSNKLFVLPKHHNSLHRFVKIGTFDPLGLFICKHSITKLSAKPWEKKVWTFAASFTPLKRGPGSGGFPSPQKMYSSMIQQVSCQLPSIPVPEADRCWKVLLSRFTLGCFGCLDIHSYIPVKHQPGPVFPTKSILDKNQTIGVCIEHIKKVLEEDQLRRILREMLEEDRSFRLNDFK